MREIQRRRAINRALRQGEAKASSKIANILTQRFKQLKREIRRANLRKRLYKAIRDNKPHEQATGIDWTLWITLFAMGLTDAFTSVIQDVYSVEETYWMGRGQSLTPLNPDDVIANYEARIGRQITAIAEETKAAVLNEITAWYNSNEALPDLLDRLDPYFSESRADTIARTESAFIASQVTRDTMQQLGITEFNVDLAPELNGWPCQECISQSESNPHSINDQFPPFHPNCLLPGNMVTIPDLVGAIKSFYVGLCVEITLGNGSKITVTQNHPILTPNGWVKAKFLNEGGNVLIATNPQRIAQRINPYYQYRPTRVEEIFSAFMKSSQVVSRHMKVSPEDFYGDGKFIQGDVNIINMHGFLRGKGDTLFSQPLNKFVLNWRRISTGFLNANGALYQILNRFAFAAYRVVTGFSAYSAFFGRQLAPFQKFGFGLSAHVDTTFGQYSSNSRPINTISLSNRVFGFTSNILRNNRIVGKLRPSVISGLLFAPHFDTKRNQSRLEPDVSHTKLAAKFCQTFASDIAPCNIVKINQFFYQGDVYDLQANNYELYLTDNVITSNCRCGVSYIVET